jgi:hypothetical protein
LEPYQELILFLSMLPDDVVGSPSGALFDWMHGEDAQTACCDLQVFELGALVASVDGNAGCYSCAVGLVFSVA